MSSLQSLDGNVLFDLARKVIFELPDSTPLGGGSRDYSEKRTFLREFNENQKEGQRQLAQAGLFDFSYRNEGLVRGFYQRRYARRKESI